MPASRDNVHLYKGRETEFYMCLTKDQHSSALIATKQAYALECIRRGKQYAVYTCPYCNYYHIGHKSAKYPG